MAKKLFQMRGSRGTSIENLVLVPQNALLVWNMNQTGSTKDFKFPLALVLLNFWENLVTVPCFVFVRAERDSVLSGHQFVTLSCVFADTQVGSVFAAFLPSWLWSLCLSDGYVTAFRWTENVGRKPGVLSGRSSRAIETLTKQPTQPEEQECIWSPGERAAPKHPGDFCKQMLISEAEKKKSRLCSWRHPGCCQLCCYGYQL